MNDDNWKDKPKTAKELREIAKKYHIEKNKELFYKINHLSSIGCFYAYFDFLTDAQESILKHFGYTIERDPYNFKPIVSWKEKDDKNE